MQRFNSLRPSQLAAIALTGSLTVAAPASAARFTAAEIGYDSALLSNFNLVTLGTLNATQSVSTEGRVLVEGALSISAFKTYGACSSIACAGNAATAVDPTGLNYGALTVFGNLQATAATLQAGFNVTSANRTANGNTAYINGTVAGTFQANGTTATTGADININGSGSGLTVNVARKITTTSAYLGTTTGSTANRSFSTASAATVFPFSTTALTSEINHLAQGIANLPGTPQTLPPQTNGMFTAAADWTSNGQTYGVITTTMATLAGQTNFTGINNGTNAATFVVVTGDGANYTLPNLNSYADAGKVIFEFVDATTLKFAGAWNGSILAPLATITTMGGAISGTVIVNAITQSQNITSANMFIGNLTGLVPEPASMTLFGLGTAAAVFVRRRRVSEPG